jgi:uncharacterized membrane protein
MMNWIGSGWGGQPGWAPWLMMLGWAPLVAAAVWAIARLTRTSHRQLDAAKSPRAILDRRLVAGEIDAEKYAQSLRALEDKRTPTAPG